MGKRLCLSFFAIALCFSFLTSRLYGIFSNEEYKNCAERQSINTINVMDERGTIYDRNFKPIVNKEYVYIASVNPNEASADFLFKNLPQEKRPELEEKLKTHLPFTIEVPDDNFYAPGIDIFEVPRRYSKNQEAVHLTGQIKKDTGEGLSGLEKSYDSLLKASSGIIDLSYTSDALNHSVNRLPPKIKDSSERIKGGIVTTLDIDIQRIAERAGKNIKKGAIVVMDPFTGDILASASFPAYDPDNMEKSLNDPSKPFINRCLYPFAVGSTFKLLTAATALEEGITKDFSHNCKGYIEVGNNIFKCHKLSGHGEIAMEEAIEKSCNTYFINLSQNINCQSLLKKAKALKFGEILPLAPELFTFSGSLPSENDLTAPEAQANFSFGQGDLTATPIQIATLISSFANGGYAVTPRLIEGSTYDGRSFLSHSTRYEPISFIHPKASEEVKDMMISVVKKGSGKKGKPVFGGAGGKTASAQSGQFDKSGEEIVHAWFSGFYPAKSPKYAIVVLNEGAFSGGDEAAPVFKEICDEIYKLKGEEILKDENESKVKTAK